MKKLFSIFTLALFAFVLVSCDKKDDEPKPELKPKDGMTTITLSTFGKAEGILSDKQNFNFTNFSGINENKKWVSSAIINPDASKIVVSGLKSGVTYSNVEVFLVQDAKIKLNLGTLSPTDNANMTVNGAQSTPFLTGCLNKLVSSKSDMQLQLNLKSDTDVTDAVKVTITVKAKFYF